LLENSHLLRDRVQEEKDAESHRQMLKAFGPVHGDRENAYRQLLLQTAYWSGIPGVVERVALIERARGIEEYQALVRRFETDELPQLVQAWRAERHDSAEAAVARVGKLLDRKRQTLSMQAPRDALRG